MYYTNIVKYNVLGLFFKKSALGLHHLLEPGPEQLARLDDVGLGQVLQVLAMETFRASTLGWEVLQALALRTPHTE